MVNRYDNPAEAQFINTYVPIPFEQLYALGKAAGDRIDKALTTFRTARDNWSKFQSESMVDNANWDKVTMQDTGIRDLVNQMAANPDLIKDSRYQMALTSAINNVDTAAMRNLQQSAKNFEIRKENIARLIAQNKYNEAWHLMNNSGWNTLQQGIFTDVNPTPYQTSAEMVRPYLDDLKDSFLENKGGYNWYGVTKDTTRKQVDAHLSDILATPQAREYVKQYMRSGADYDTAVNMLTNQLYNASEEFARRKGEVDPYGVLRARQAGSEKPVNSFSRIAHLNADLGQRQMSLLQQAGKSEGLTEDNFPERYNELYKEAFKKGNASMRKLMQDGSTRVGEQETDLILNPNLTKNDYQQLSDSKGKKTNVFVFDRDMLHGVVPLNEDGIPMLDIAPEYIRNNESSLLNQFNMRGKRNNKEKLDAFNGIIQSFVEQMPEVLVKTNGSIFQYGRINEDYPIESSPMIPSKIYIPTKYLDEYYKKNKDSLGNLSKGDVTDILSEGIGGKHKLVTKRKNLKLNDSDEEQDYFEINVALPMDDPARRSAFDAKMTGNLYTPTKSYDNHQTQTGYAYDLNYNTNSNL